MARVLVVDDSESDRKMVEFYLSRQDGFSIESVSNANAALESVEASPPDIIVTDLQMPGMNGLELIQRVHSTRSHIPIILITAFGNELLAAEALRKGAASYVPKSALKEWLLATVQEVLELSRAERGQAREFRWMRKAKFEFELGLDPKNIPPLVDLIQQAITGVGACDSANRLRVAVALEEALLNALYHGNLEISSEALENASAGLLQTGSVPLADERRSQSPYCDRKISLTAEISSEECRFVVSDEGPGFDRESLPDPSDLGALECKAGRGILLMEAFMDEVTFPDSGSSVVMIKRWSASSESQPASEVRQIGALFHVRETESAIVVRPVRNISSFAEATVQKELHDLLEKLDHGGAKHLLMDFADLEYFGSCMLEAMRVLAVQVRQLQGKLGVCNISPVARQVLELARFDKVWEFHETFKDAIDAVKDE
ncbi:MAG: response regulator [Planctomycetes bacterium]|nr:response regulator [Planctomycetota bacterium]